MNRSLRLHQQVGFAVCRRLRSSPTAVVANKAQKLSMASNTGEVDVGLGGESGNSSLCPVQASITEKLTKLLSPSYLDVINESHMHNVPKNSETHFKVVVVSTQFDTIKSPIQRHRLVHGALEEELKHPVHALSIVAKSPSQWESMIAAGKSIPPSPNCRGGDGSLPPK